MSPTDRPLIGIIACNRPVEGEPAQIVKARYIDAVIRFAEAVPVLCPSTDRPEDAEILVRRLDAVLLTGSNSNIEPHRYGGAGAGAPPHDAERDGMSAALVKAAIAAGKPVFGICRGLQEINVALGGSLFDQREKGHGVHHAPDGVSLEEMFGHGHVASPVEGSQLSDFAGGAPLQVNSVHYQTIERLGDGLVIGATAEDGVIEAVESPRGTTPVLAVQWHPEWRPETRPHDMAFWREVGRLARR
ncbi:gamma-glutamyl-gamma-aminobutyrate hydrolase family protein [Arsenicitalea aurantiaca]|uniref:Gamma-glutamyl-gamma-aminobutyrate hydrolase family protein n=1 Tax=Arsenicitalea aurantiaca TaxID=1783274 RepID=A0A433XAX3_9HYPH|nr:gamma-glutamyl-gamma-aminobutyrate hydrolase family protein [Arsenicitalea aurantiaca]RUT31251.1 gamma-glutamyl-gamma-aminobutyrate hydrolase family protein [Arsenicitalea aurantiaca]